MNGLSRFFKPLLYIYIYIYIYFFFRTYIQCPCLLFSITCSLFNVIINIQFFVINRIIQLLVANWLLINYLSIYLSIYQYYLVKILQENAFFYSVKNRPKIPIFSTFINNEILRNFEGKKSPFGTENFRRSIIPQ